MKILKTPEERFKNLEGYPFKSHFINIEEGLTMHYVDEGPQDGPVALLLHGEPSWSYLYRKMIPKLAEKFRVIAPDLIGFGKSDKPAEQSDYTYTRHVRWITTFIRKLDLRNILLFCQDWGGLVGLRVVTSFTQRFTHIVASNTALPTGDIPMPEAFAKWQEFAANSPEFDIGKIIAMGTAKPIPLEVEKAYNAPFPSEEYKAGARIFPKLVPTVPNDPEAFNNKKAWETFAQWDKPFLTVFGKQDDIMRGAEMIFQSIIPGARNQPHTYLDAGHFIQEDEGEKLAEIIPDFYKNTT